LGPLVFEYITDEPIIVMAINTGKLSPSWLIDIISIIRRIPRTKASDDHSVCLVTVPKMGFY
jgi:hypothetical protein